MEESSNWSRSEDWEAEGKDFQWRLGAQLRYLHLFQLLPTPWNIVQMSSAKAQGWTAHQFGYTKEERWLAYICNTSLRAHALNARRVTSPYGQAYMS